MGEVYWSDKVSYETVRRWRKKFLTGTESVKDAAKSGRPVTVTGKANVSKVREIIESDGRYCQSSWHIAIAGAFHFEAYFECTKDFCQMDTAYVVR